MGATLSEPVTTKDTNAIRNEDYIVGSSCMQGWRLDMEDAHTHILSLPDDKDTSFFGVYDGHGGPKVSQFAGLNLHKRIVQSEKFKSGNIEEGIVDGFIALDEQMLNDEFMKKDTSGSTAVICLIKNNILYTGNSGDSRAVASVNGCAIPLSYDHKPQNADESRRIYEAGGFVEFSRVNGNLALSRALGDFCYKQREDLSPSKQIVTVVPEVTTHKLNKDFEFLIIACDGIWDVMSNQAAVDFVRAKLAEGIPPEEICESMLNHCLSPDSKMEGLGCDNMTLIIVCLLQGDTQEEFIQRVKRPADFTTIEKFDIKPEETEPYIPPEDTNRGSSSPIGQTIRTARELQENLDRFRNSLSNEQDVLECFSAIRDVFGIGINENEDNSPPQVFDVDKEDEKKETKE
ncbi:Protein phosphatase 2C (PP2C)-like domain-containing protein [Strongyloides ratti]|uniref:protein-serine/threonine phosphatase n=1 Tax=Strongyloides ratti TaxID=34506 RepID=A0A090LJQ8_STRRB|nr:Protein phosphatase 2C (PP2C)-like domain-containing protein [Strongyloides ratti]CEF67745.1 Protein phosphatase 2C (PP2C)-like domain-containing protein [Strongyloides ratti]